MKKCSDNSLLPRLRKASYSAAATRSAASARSVAPARYASSSLRSQSGFTLIELMITLVIAAILLGIGVPSYRTVLQNSRASALSADLTSGINLARAEAIRRGAAVQLCPSSDGATCTGTWVDGWIASVVADGEILRVWSAPTAGSAITQTLTAANTALVFGALGQLTSGDTNIVASVDGCSGERARRLSLAASGRVSVSRTLCP